MKNFYQVQLKRTDLMEFEGYLADALRGILLFASYSIYYPKAELFPTEPQYITRERSLLLPLCHDGMALGVFMAKGVEARNVKRLNPSLDALIALCMQYILCIKQSRIDEVTGLERMLRLLERMEHNVEMVRTYYNDGSDTQVALHKACMGLIVLRCPALDSLAAEFGYAFATKALSEWTKALKENLPQEVLAARSGENECALLLPAVSRTSCSAFAEEIMAKVDAVTLMHEPTKRTISLHSVSGFALYPQDMENTRMSLGVAEQGHYILQKARHAAHMAYERSLFLSKKEKKLVQNRYLAYARVLAQGGIIQDILSHGQVLTNLGRQAGAREGQYFSVWGQKDDTWQRKGEIVLMAVRNSHSVADILHLYDAAWAWQQGDNLRLVDVQQSAQLTGQEQEAKLDSDHQVASLLQESLQSKMPSTEVLLSHGDFLRQLSTASEQHASFSLALVRVLAETNSDLSNKDAIEIFLNLYHQGQDEESKHSVFKPFDGKKETLPTFMGRYGETSLIFFHPAITSQALEQDYKTLIQYAKEAKIHVTVGLASYPYLQANKSDILNYCHKALELALLLPKPQVGSMGSLAFNISADQRYSRGDVFGAVEEYKLAILADAENTMAWNSLGVCMAALNRFSDARQYFQESLKLLKKNTPDVQNSDAQNLEAGEEITNTELASTLYNLGTVCQSLGDIRAATKYFKQCITVNDAHYFAQIRLGQLAEKSGKLQQARQYYNQALQCEQKAHKDSLEGHGSSTGMVYRHLARVALLQGKNAEARELLHETLLHNPQDAVALCMLAQVYLEGGEDPAMSEMLARKSVGLRPEYAPAWRALGQSLRALGREADALNAEDRASTL